MVELRPVALLLLLLLLILPRHFTLGLQDEPKVSYYCDRDLPRIDLSSARLAKRPDFHVSGSSTIQKTGSVLVASNQHPGGIIFNKPILSTSFVGRIDFSISRQTVMATPTGFSVILHRHVENIDRFAAWGPEEYARTLMELSFKEYNISNKLVQEIRIFANSRGSMVCEFNDIGEERQRLNEPFHEPRIHTLLIEYDYPKLAVSLDGFEVVNRETELMDCVTEEDFASLAIFSHVSAGASANYEFQHIRFTHWLPNCVSSPVQSECSEVKFDKHSFSESSNILLTGGATAKSVSSLFIYNPENRYDQSVGVVSLVKPLAVSNYFAATLDMSVHNCPSISNCAEKLVISIKSSDSMDPFATRVFAGGSDLPFWAPSVAIAFDDATVRIYNVGSTSGRKRSLEPTLLGESTTSVAFKNNKFHRIKVEYLPSPAAQLRIFVDRKLVLASFVDLSALLSLDEGAASLSISAQPGETKTIYAFHALVMHEGSCTRSFVMAGSSSSSSSSTSSLTKEWPKNQLDNPEDEDLFSSLFSSWRETTQRKQYHAPYWNYPAPVMAPITPPEMDHTVALAVSIPLYAILLIAFVGFIGFVVSRRNMPHPVLPAPHLAAPLAAQVPAQPAAAYGRPIQRPQAAPQPAGPTFELDPDDEGSLSGSNIELEERACLICYNHHIATTLVPCGHRVACRSCAAYFQAQHPCALCRTPIEAVLYDGDQNQAASRAMPVTNAGAPAQQPHREAGAGLAHRGRGGAAHRGRNQHHHHNRHLNHRNGPAAAAEHAGNEVEMQPVAAAPALEGAARAASPQNGGTDSSDDDDEHFPPISNQHDVPQPVVASPAPAAAAGPASSPTQAGESSEDDVDLNEVPRISPPPVARS